MLLFLHENLYLPYYINHYIYNPAVPPPPQLSLVFVQREGKR